MKYENRKFTIGGYTKRFADNWERTFNNDKLAEEAGKWSRGEIDLSGFEDAPDTLPNNVFMRVPITRTIFSIINEFAKRKDIDWQTLVRRWVEERLRVEAAAFFERDYDNEVSKLEDE